METFSPILISLDMISLIFEKTVYYVKIKTYILKYKVLGFFILIRALENNQRVLNLLKINHNL